MKTVQRANRQLRVADDRLTDMLAAGYAEIDEKTGKPIAVPTVESDDTAALKKENAALKKENKALKARVKALTEKAKQE